jgi:hypothetical protein
MREAKNNNATAPCPEGGGEQRTGSEFDALRAGFAFLDRDQKVTDVTDARTLCSDRDAMIVRVTQGL